jgi:hypothetical protein
LAVGTAWLACVAVRWLEQNVEQKTNDR